MNSKYVKYVGLNGRGVYGDFDTTIGRIYKVVSDELSNPNWCSIWDDIDDNHDILMEHLEESTEQEYVSQELCYNGQEWIAISKYEYDELKEIKKSYFDLCGRM